MSIRVKLNSRNQIAIPAQVRRLLKLKAGDHLLVEVRDGSAILLPEPEDFAAQLRGLHRDVWEGKEPQEYVRRERDAWQD